MEPKIVTLDELLLVGMSFYGDPFAKSSGWSEENEIGLLWRRLKISLEKNPDAIKHRTQADVCYEVWTISEETEKKGMYEIFVGTAVRRLENIPVQFLIKQLPATQYAMFTLKGDDISSDWEKEIYQGWLSNSKYQTSYNFNFQYHDHRFKGINELKDSELDVYVPIKPRI